MPLTEQERDSIKQEVFQAMNEPPRGEIFRSVYGSERIGVLSASNYFTSKPLAFQRQLLIMLAERQVFTQTVGGVTTTYQERCRDTGQRPNVWGTDNLTGEEFLKELRNNTINQKPELYRCVFVGLFRTTYAKNWAHWLNLNSGTRNPNQSSTNVGLLNYQRNSRWNGSDYAWGLLHNFVVGLEGGGNIEYGLLPQLWVDAIDALEPSGETTAIMRVKTPPPVYIFSLETLPDFDKNTFVMIDLLGETPPAVFQDVLAAKVKSRGKATVFNALYNSSERRKVERYRLLVKTAGGRNVWDNNSYTWVRENPISEEREIVYETKNYLTLSQAMSILNTL